MTQRVQYFLLGDENSAVYTAHAGEQFDRNNQEKEKKKDEVLPNNL